mmetsp:Transcript_5247/g.7588  ORF Transcript_5247/g.7588 Transcript_5247/m.7588 type:complete len:256 (+) Transcript_5247:94-861(+)|eukprot:CAMPEP_0202477790 /NCGR_PEP_ID=MMETSP1360-20130828/94120_1 /ASSEMBLY_ACC=CAM_ASM_000848 /TAXON_ID=515479 /ORGANISM="Licmophora paradoxa, Strain CCMP2313" /LENGTH=255 /DNA_ID=CAMNT_0049105043 /DNA_START=93 /DNA_END=860 /DNA_ORIENTATION=+
MSLKTAVVTGANRGLGLEIVKQLSEREDVGKIFALCRKAGDKLKATEKIEVVEGINIMDDAVVKKLQDLFKTKSSSLTPIHCLIHNAGAYGPPEKFNGIGEIFQSQSLSNVTMERMRFAFEVNTLAPLKITQALQPNLKEKVIIITSLMGSITDNTSGGSYGYRTAKAGVNMIGKSLAEDLKEDGIAVGLIHPGIVATGFGNSEGKDWETKLFSSQRGVVESAKGVLEAVDSITIETTGAFLHGNYGEGVKPLPW